MFPFKSAAACTLRSWSCWKWTAHIVKDESNTAPKRVIFAPCCRIRGGVRRSTSQRTDHDLDAMINKYKHLHLRFSLFTTLIATPGPEYRLKTCSMAPLQVSYQSALAIHYTQFLYRTSKLFWRRWCKQRGYQHQRWAGWLKSPWNPWK